MSLQIEKAEWTKLFDLVITQGYGVSLGKEWAIINVGHSYTLSEEISEGVLGAAAKVALAEAISETLISRIGALSHLTFRINESMSTVCTRLTVVYPSIYLSETLSEGAISFITHSISIEEAISELVVEYVSRFVGSTETITEGSWISLQESLIEQITEAVVVNVAHFLAVAETLSEIGSENVSHQLDLYEAISEVVLTSVVVDLAETIAEIVVLNNRQSVMMSEGAYASKGLTVSDVIAELSKIAGFSKLINAITEAPNESKGKTVSDAMADVSSRIVTHIQKFYLHDKTNLVSGTLPPATTESATAYDELASDAATNRLMDMNVGSSQAALTFGSVETTSKQNDWLRRFCSSELAGQTIPAGTWTIRAAIKTSDAAHSHWRISAIVYVWRPSNGTLVGRIVDAVTSGIGTQAAVSETDITEATITASGASLDVLAGDILVVEVWGTVTQSAANSYTWTLYYDGTTEGSTTTNAAFLKAPSALTMGS